MTDTSHLDAIDLRLSHERARVTSAKTEKEREWREHNVRMIEREREGEIAFLAKRGIKIDPTPTIDDIMSDPLLTMSDDELLAALSA